MVYGDDHNLFIDRIIGLPSLEICLDELKGDPVPLEDVYPSFSPQFFSLVPDPLPNNTFVKLPNIVHYKGYMGKGERNDNISMLLLGEAKVCEVLIRSPHRNLAKHLGCQVRGGRIVALCFQKYMKTLTDCLVIDRARIDKRQVLNDIRSGIEHIHSLGYCHNDISPGNVMFDKDGTAVIIDFDACRLSGEELGIKKGTPGYMKEGITLSQASNDFFGLERIEDYIDEHLIDEGGHSADEHSTEA